jgi:hypothetical protein
MESVAWDRQRNRGFFSDLVRGVSKPRQGSKILSFLFWPDWCAARSLISGVRGQ